MAPIVSAVGLGLLDKLSENPAGLARQALQGACVLALGSAIILGYRGYYLEKNGMVPPPTFYAGSESGLQGTPAPAPGEGETGSGSTGGLTANETLGSIVDKAGWPESQKAHAVAVAFRESGGKADAVNNWDSNAAAGTPSIGLFQIILPTAQSVDSSATTEKLKNPLFNAQVALKLWRAQGWAPWSTTGGWQQEGDKSNTPVTGYTV